MKPEAKSCWAIPKTFDTDPDTDADPEKSIIMVNSYDEKCFLVCNHSAGLLTALILVIKVGVGIGVGVEKKIERRSHVGLCPTVSIPIPTPTKPFSL